MLRREPMQRGSCNFTASCKPLISLMKRACTIIFSLIPRSIMSICINMSHFNSVHNWCSHVDFEVRYTRVHHFPKTRHHMSQVHCHRQEPETKASMRMAMTQHFWESTKCNRKSFADFGEHEANFWMSEWLANIKRNHRNRDRFILRYYIILTCVLLKFGRKTNMTIFSKIHSSWKHSLELIECISKNMSHIDLVRFVTNMFWWLLSVFWLFYRIAILPCAGGALLLQVHPEVVSSAISSFQMLRTVAKQAAPHTSQGYSSQPGNVGGWLCARIPCHRDFTFDLVPWDLTSKSREIHSTSLQERYLDIVLLLYVHCFNEFQKYLWTSYEVTVRTW